MNLHYRIIRKALKRYWWRFRNLPFEKFLKTIFSSKLDKIIINDDVEHLFNSSLQDSTSQQQESSIPQLYLLIKPSGMEFESEIKKILERENLKIVQEREIKDFKGLAFYLFNIPNIRTIDDMPEGYIWIKILEMKYKEKSNIAKVLVLNETTIKTLDKVKKKIRKEIGVDFYRVLYKGKNVVTCLTHVHTPSKNDIEKEWKLINLFSNSL